MADKTVMQAPKGANPTAVIDGHTYTLNKSGKITVVNPDHVPTLKRHGFIESFDDISAENLEAMIDEMDDKDELVTFIEERGGEADSDMSFKKLKRLAREAVAENKE